MGAQVIGWLLGGLWPYLAAGAVALLGVLGSYMAGKRNARQNAKIEGLEGYREIRERIDDAQVALDADDARERLRNRDPKQR